MFIRIKPKPALQIFCEVVPYSFKVTFKLVALIQTAIAGRGHKHDLVKYSFYVEK